MSSHKEIRATIKCLQKLLVSTTKDLTTKKKSKSSSTKTVEKCKSKTDLKRFTIKVLEQWCKDRGVRLRSSSGSRKDYLVRLVWSELQEDSSDSSGSSSDSDSSGSSDTDSDSSDTDSD